ncbi:MAG: hypothetical protein EG823_05245 [Actinobacteria bacterium]|nr:hypothetical protein [Actinomycetota bacterium]
MAEVNVYIQDDLLENEDSDAAALGCDFYAACAPAIAAMLDAELVSADRQAHAAFPGVRLVG